MAAPDLSLLARRRFAPLFVVQFLGAFNDNLLRFAMVFLATFTLYAGESGRAEMLATIAAGLFTLPYFLLSSIAGQLADGIDKARLVRWVKAAEIAIMAIALAGFAAGSIPVLLACVVAMGVHSTLFGPVKYSILPQHLHRDEIMGGTGLIEAGTFLAILAGQLLGGLIGPWQAGLVALGVSVAGFAASWLVPSAPPATTRQPIDWNIVRGTVRILRAAQGGRGVWLAILGISWFFGVGTVVTAQLTPLAHGTLGAGPRVVTVFLLVFSVGVALGSLLVNRLLRGEVSARYVPGAALAMAASLIVLWIAARAYTPGPADWPAFVAQPQAWSVLGALAGLAVAGGCFVVPLYAILQTHADPAKRSQIIAANNIINAVVTVALTVVVVLMIGQGAGVPGVIGALGFATLAVALISCWLLPETVFKALARAVLTMVYRIQLKGAEHMPRPGERAVVVVNHVSFLDGLLLAAFLPGKPTFAVHTRIAQAWWVRPFLGLFDAFPVDPTNPMAAKAMVRAVRDGRILVIFPEGRITVTGALMKVFDGPGMVADKADAPIVPVRIDGAQFTPFSRLGGKVRRRWFPRITLTVLPQRRFAVEGDSARSRRAAAGRALYDVMSDAIFATSDIDRTLFGALLDAKDIHGAKAAVVEDVQRVPLTYGRLVTGALALARPLSAGTAPSEAIGVLLPNVTGVVATFFALQFDGRVPAMLNFTAGSTNVRAACTAARIRTVVTARAFVAQSRLEPLIADLEGTGVAIRYLEDIRATLGLAQRLRALALTGWAGRLHRRRHVSPDSPAVILFTSGSEGLPKGVVLTHRNLLANCEQLSARIDFNESDVVLNALPVFHSFGLTGGTLLPVLHGVKTLLYPSPLHYRIVPALAYDANATILFGTDTFLAGYARMAHGYDFYSLRYIFAGAERVRDETRRLYADKFGLRILEGYGATEAAPVIAVNTPMHFQAGTVGRLLPGVEARVDPVPGIAEGGRLSIRGPNIMAGYLKADRPGELQPPSGGWHDTGDIVTLDAAGFVTIRGRAKRFAKIGGEMISLPAVEGYAAALWPDAEHAVVTRPDARKGEQLVLFTTRADATPAALQAWGRANGVTELMLPREVRVMDALPVLGTGKLDYVTMTARAIG